jgi:TetR/AcrR family transcriptional regulator of autoinduction and epiphytic fitness
MEPVKSHQPTRADRARHTRRRMLDSARQLFIANGYAATTMERIADQAGVAVQTLYYTFRTKGQLLCEVVEASAAENADTAPVAQPAWMQEMLTATTSQRVLALAVDYGADIFARAAPLWPAVTAAAADPYVKRYWRNVAANRRAGQGRMVARLAELDELRHGLDPHRATDRVVVLFGHDVFGNLVTDAGWSLPEYKAWLYTTLIQQLLEQPELTPTAYSDRSFSPLISA